MTSESPQALKIALNQLSCRVTETRWREVYLLSEEILRNADYLLQLMKQQIDQLVAQDPDIQSFLTWVNQKAGTVITPHKLSVIRAFYLDLALASNLALIDRTLALPRTLEPMLTRMLARPLALDLSLDRALCLNRVLGQVSNPSQVVSSVLERALIHAGRVDLRLERSLQQLKEQLPPLAQNTKTFMEWWHADGQAWTEQLNAVVIKYRNLGHSWQWNVEQQQTLQQYYTTNRLLVECLSNSFYVSRDLRSEIEAKLLLPITEIEPATD